jgi:hypothetical protein
MGDIVITCGAFDKKKRFKLRNRTVPYIARPALTAWPRQRLRKIMFKKQDFLQFEFYRADN